MGSKEVIKDSKQKQEKETGNNERKRNGQDDIDKRALALQEKSPEKYNDRLLQRFENKRSGSPSRVRWSPPRRRSRSPRFRRSPRRMSRSPIRNRPLRRISRSPERFRTRRKLSRSPRRYNRSPVGRINSSVGFSLQKRSLSPFRRKSSRSPLNDARRNDSSDVYLRSRSPSLEILGDSHRKIMTMKAQVVETGLVPPGMEMDFNLMEMCQTKPSSKETSNTFEINKEKRITQNNRNKRSRSPASSEYPSTRINYSPPSSEPKKYRNFLEEIEDTFVSKEAPLQKNISVETSHQSMGEKDIACSTREREINVQHTTQVVSRISASPARQEKSCLDDVSQSKKQTRTTPKLLEDAKKATGDNVHHNLNLSVTDKRKTIQNKIHVISQCQNAIKLLSRDRKDGHFKIREPSEKREEILDLKGICPLRKVRVVRFQYTSKTTAKKYNTSNLVNKLLAKVLKEPSIDVATSCEVIDLCESPGNTIQEKQYLTQCELPVSLNSIQAQEKVPKKPLSKISTAIKETGSKNVVNTAVQTEENQCGECQKRKNIMRDNMYTQTNETLFFDVGCQINLNDISPNSPKTILKMHNITQFTSGQLLQQHNQGSMSEKSPSTIDLDNSKKRLCDSFFQQSEKRRYNDRCGSSSGESKRPSGNEVLDFDIFSNRSYEYNRYENTTSSEAKLFSRDRPQISRPLLGKKLPFSNFDPKLNFDTSFGRWTKKY